MANYLPSIAVDAVIAALGVFLQPFATDPAGNPTEIIRGQVNRTPAPITSYICLTEMHIIDLETPSFAWTEDLLSLTGPAQIDVQIDFYGPASADQCKAFKGIYRSIYAVAQFPPGIAPLYCTDGMNMPLITGEMQYEQRWSMTASLQYNPVVTIPLQTAGSLSINEIEQIA